MSKSAFAASVLWAFAAIACKSERTQVPSESAQAACATPSGSATICTDELERPKPAAVSGQPSFCREACDDAGRSFDETQVVPLKQAGLGDLTRCPVSGAVFRVSADTPRVEHSGRTHWVCCDGCAEKFRESPARFDDG